VGTKAGESTVRHTASAVFLKKRVIDLEDHLLLHTHLPLFDTYFVTARKEESLSLKPAKSGGNPIRFGPIEEIIA